MALFRSETEEEKAAKAAQREREEAEKAQREYLESPIGQADQAHDRGDLFFQIEIPHASMKGSVTWAGNLNKKKTYGGAPDTLGQIEQLGWRLEHASWVYVQTGQESRDKFASSGQQVVVKGEVVGIYLFRRADTPI
jgi:hypothetical protein